jgi:hypothetical protein
MLLYVQKGIGARGEAKPEPDQKFLPEPEPHKMMMLHNTG